MTHRDERDALGALAPRTPVDPEGLAAAQRAVERMIVADAPTELRPSVHPHRMARRLSIAAAAVVLGLVASIVGGSRELPAASAAAELLMSASSAAAAQPVGGVDATYWHVVTEVEASTGEPERVEAWWARDGDSVVQVPGTQRFTVAHAWQFGLGGEARSWKALQDLPTDPAQLATVLRSAMESERAGRSADDGASRSVDDLLFERVAEMLRASPATPALRAALWNVAASIPGITLLGDRSDALGRRGVAVELGRQRMLVAPDTGELLEWSLLEEPVTAALDPVADEQTDGSTLVRWTVVEQEPWYSAPDVPLRARE